MISKKWQLNAWEAARRDGLVTGRAPLAEGRL